MQGLKLRQFAAALVIACGITITGTILLSVQQGVFFPFEWTADYQRTDYGVTIDAGSHGTRAHLYRWAGRVEDPSHPLQSPVTIPIEIATVAPPDSVGVAEFLDDPSMVGERVLKPIIEGLQERLVELEVPQSVWSTIRIFFKATAGLRNADVDARDAIMDHIRSWLIDPLKSPFHFQLPWARVISGEEEGTFGWISVNNIAGTILSPANGTLGSLDLGGASAQITFMPTHTSVLEDFYELQLGANPVRLYSHSFIGYGWEDSLSRLTSRLGLETVFAHLSQDPALRNTPLVSLDVPNEIQLGRVPNITLTDKKKHQFDAAPELTAVVSADHPCFPAGYKYVYTLPDAVYPDGRSFLDLDMRAILSYLAASGIDLTSPIVQRHIPATLYEAALHDPFAITTNAPVTLNQQQPSPFRPWAEPLPQARVRYQIHFNGTGDFYACQDRAKALFYQEPCFLNTCSFNGIYQPRIAESRFLALGQFSKVRSALSIPVSATPNTLEKAAAKFCETQWGDLVLSHKAGNFSPFRKGGLPKLCWKALWAHTILTHGYGLEGESRAVTFWSPPDGDFRDAPGWALGSMVAEISYYPWQNTRGRFVAPYWWAFSTLVALGTLTLLQQKRINNYRAKLAFLKVNRSDIYEDLVE